MQTIIIKDGIVDNNYIRVICEEKHGIDYDHGYDMVIDKCYKLQIKIHGFLLTKFHTIKTWKFNFRDVKADELAKNEAIEVFNYLINPYKHGELCGSI